MEIEAFSLKTESSNQKSIFRSLLFEKAVFFYRNILIARVTTFLFEISYTDNAQA